jgi:hypothetical protein
MQDRGRPRLPPVRLRVRSSRPPRHSLFGIATALTTAGARLANGTGPPPANFVRDIAAADGFDPCSAPRLSTSLGTTAGRGSSAHNICAGHGSCALLLAADGPKLGEGRRPDLGIGAQDERLAAELDRAQSAGAYLLIRRLTADPVGITKVSVKAGASIFNSPYVCGGGRVADHRCPPT